MSRNYWQRINFSQISPNLLELIVMPAYQVLGAEFFGDLMPMSGHRKSQFHYEFERRSRQLLHGTIYRFIPKTNINNPNELVIEVWEMLIDNE